MAMFEKEKHEKEVSTSNKSAHGKYLGILGYHISLISLTSPPQVCSSTLGIQNNDEQKVVRHHKNSIYLKK